jgi:two-component system sensor histidine kinase ChvG
MAQAIATPMISAQIGALWPFRPTTISLTVRILAVNILALALLAGSIFYLDNYRVRLLEERSANAREQSGLVKDALTRSRSAASEEMIEAFARRLQARIRIYDRTGNLVLDSQNFAPDTLVLLDPEAQPMRRHVARTLDRMVEFMVGAEQVDNYAEPAQDQLCAWPELRTALNKRSSVSRLRNAPDRTPMINAAVPLTIAQHPDWRAMMITENARDITSTVRAERTTVVLLMLSVAIISTLLSLFLARTIVYPIRQLAHAAVRVRLGREPEVTIARMPERRDEIGRLARALSDMSHALRQRIDTTEAFAADVTHEIKNPLASLRSALESLERADDPAVRDQLIAIAASDVRRIDRLINDISDASRIDGELSRTRFEPIDIGEMIEQLLAAREQRDTNAQIRVAYARPMRGSCAIMGDDGRLERVFNNLLDNAVSFSPPGGLIQISAETAGNEVIIRIADEGPGIAPEKRRHVFERFYSSRDDSENFGQHSGLGLAIARTIVEGHGGSIAVRDKADGERGACLEVRLPVSQECP